MPGTPCESCSKPCESRFCGLACALWSSALCEHCGAPTDNARFCSAGCYAESRRLYALNSWLSGQHSGVGKEALIKSYLTEIRGEGCEQCGWAEIHPVTGRIPIQMDHIDGNWQNNQPDNLRLLCPSCHSLTENFGWLNRREQRAARGEPILLRTRRTRAA